MPLSYLALPAPALAPDRVQPGVRGGHPDPGGRVLGRLRVREPPQRGDEHVLGHILRGGRVAHDAAGDPDHGRIVLAEEALERGRAGARRPGRRTGHDSGFHPHPVLGLRLVSTAAASNVTPGRG